MINNDFLCFFLCPSLLTIGSRCPTFQCPDPITLPSATSLKWHQLVVIHIFFGGGGGLVNLFEK